MYLDRFYLPGRQTSLFNEGIIILRNTVFEKIKTKLAKTIIAYINKERAEDIVP